MFGRISVSIGDHGAKDGEQVLAAVFTPLPGAAVRLDLAVGSVPELIIAVA
jgi:hypothetical protein